MHKFLVVIIIGILPALATAGVYKWVDADGAVHFSDVPKEGAEEVHVAPPQSYSAPSFVPITPRPDVAEEPAEYSAFSLAVPEAEASYWGEAASIDVSFSAQPELQIGRGHKLVVLVDGQARPAVAANSLTLNELERGSHALQGQIVDSVGRVLMTSQSITVHIHRPSTQGPQRAKPKQ